MIKWQLILRLSWKMSSLLPSSSLYHSLPVSHPCSSSHPTLFSPTCLPSSFVSLSFWLVSNSLCLSNCPSLSVGCIERLVIIKVQWRWPDSDSVFNCIYSWIFPQEHLCKFGFIFYFILNYRPQTLEWMDAERSFSKMLRGFWIIFEFNVNVEDDCLIILQWIGVVTV